jgi:hypothetical protein
MLCSSNFPFSRIVRFSIDIIEEKFSDESLLEYLATGTIEAIVLIRVQQERTVVKFNKFVGF